MKYSKFYLCIVFPLFWSQSTHSYNSNPLLLIVSFDGFRYDYFNRNLSETMINLRKNSSYASYMVSVFPTKTFPNHFSIATGLYTEVHGVLDNKVYDKSSNRSLGYGYDLFHYNGNVVPLWTLNERGGQGRRSGCMMWPGSDFKYQGTLPSYFRSYNGSVSWHSRVDTLISWFIHPDTPINLGMLYFEEPDLICHSYGPESEQVDNEIARVDRIVQYLIAKMQEVGILHRLNIIFLSDHGGQAVPIASNSINLDNYIDSTLYLRDGVPPTLQIYPAAGKEEEVLETLRSARNRGANFSTYTRAEMLERWHYKNCGRTPPIILCADVSFLFLEPQHTYTTTSKVIGTHGYDPLTPTMRAFFMAVGPEFKRDYSVKPFENINIFPLAAHVLGLDLPTVSPNGSLKYLQDILVRQPPSTDESTTIYLVIASVVGVLLVLVVIGWILYRRNVHRKSKLRKASTASYRVLNQNVDERRELEEPSSECDEDFQT